MIPTIVGLLYIMLYPNLCRLLMVIAILISKTTTPTAPPGIPGDFSLCTWEVAIFTDVPSTWTSCRSNSTVLTALSNKEVSWSENKGAPKFDALLFSSQHCPFGGYTIPHFQTQKNRKMRRSPPCFLPWATTTGRKFRTAHHRSFALTGWWHSTRAT